jgi:hypothetical protein
MSGSLEQHELTRSPVKKGQDFGLIKELPKYLRNLQLDIAQRPGVNLFAIYEQRRQEFMDQDASPTKIVKGLQAEYETGLNDTDVRNLHGWAKEDYDRKRGIKPKIRPHRTTQEMMDQHKQDDRTNLEEEGEE